MLLLLPLVTRLRLRLILVQLELLDMLRNRCMSSSSTPACNQSRKLEPPSRKADNGRLAEPNPQGSRPLARASTSLCLVRATVPTLSLQPKLWLTGAIMSAPIVLAEVPRAESVGEIELTRRATTCGQQRCTAATAIARVQAQPSAPPRTHRPRPHNTVCV